MRSDSRTTAACNFDSETSFYLGSDELVDNRRNCFKLFQLLEDGVDDRRSERMDAQAILRLCCTHRYTTGFSRIEAPIQGNLFMGYPPGVCLAKEKEPLVMKLTVLKLNILQKTGAEQIARMHMLVCSFHLKRRVSYFVFLLIEPRNKKNPDFCIYENKTADQLRANRILARSFL